MVVDEKVNHVLGYSDPDDVFASPAVLENSDKDDEVLANKGLGTADAKARKKRKIDK